MPNLEVIVDRKNLQPFFIGATMTNTRQKRGSAVRPDRLELTLKRCGDGPDPRLIALVRLLARQAAREAYEEQMRERRKTRS